MEPPMPRNWLENVARSILFGGAGAHIGGPDTNASHDLTMRSPARNAGAALSDHTNLPKLVGEGASAKVKAPFLCAQVDRRGRTSEGKVSCTMVMCRSAPAIKGSTRGKLPSRSVKVKGKKREADGVPSLARTKAENDEWSPRTRHLSGWGIDTEQSNDKQAASSDENDDDDDDDDGELNLERLLVPARRQHSIRSLRKHLQKSNGATGSLLGLTRKKSMQTRWTAGDTTDGGEDEEWRNRSWGTGRGRRWIVGEDDDEGDGYGYGVDGFSSSDTGTGARAGIKRRRGIPWAQ
ncbi:hypothetical protein SERLADRAFT_457102 [Serpula lacrymans var. lacrymans S7.9]|uniref:Uncharacterized protein n=1 Tax=Serpula lacrymans var. lacrymans (strain S7.9) TaxID=578457 RepID=F8NGS5_SERL9|nr:uncharacterized protein SERLADRAFT_457102 [Serpula lacrymans var. lacrymans S7.9]EGO29408.1 hypothetical protein SERLADRAFT_457102 [Serpula lacrymans var. lacrymans S7.9]